MKYKHRISLLENEIMESAISTQETFETSILSPLSHSSQTESHEKVDLEEMDLAGKTIPVGDNDYEYLLSSKYINHFSCYVSLPMMRLLFC